MQDLDAGAGEQLACECLVGTWVVDNDSIERKIEYIFPQQTVDYYGGEIRANFRDDGKVEVVYDGFEVSGHSDVSRFGEAEFHTEYTSTTNARGTDSYEVKNDYIFYGSLFEEDFLVGTETIKSIKKGFMFKAEGYQVPVDEESVTTETELLGWGLFGAATKYDLQCNGTILRFLGGPSDEVTAILHRVGFAD